MNNKQAEWLRERERIESTNRDNIKAQIDENARLDRWYQDELAKIQERNRSELAKQTQLWNQKFDAQAADHQQAITAQ